MNVDTNISNLLYGIILLKLFDHVCFRQQQQYFSVQYIL